MRVAASLALVWTMVNTPAVAGQRPMDSDGVLLASRAFDSAFARADIDSIAAMLTDDVVVLSLGGHALSLEDVVESHREMFGEREGLTMSREPTQIELGPASWRVASEQGRWTESWQQDGERVVLEGTYHTMWRQDGQRWRKSAELLVALVCEGPYCGG